MLTCLLSAMSAFEGDAHVLLLPRMPYRGRGATHVPMRLYATFSYIGPKSYLICLYMVPQQTSISWVCTSQ
jgi:hypothetical protein